MVVDGSRCIWFRAIHWDRVTAGSSSLACVVLMSSNVMPPSQVITRFACPEIPAMSEEVSKSVWAKIEEELGGEFKAGSSGINQLLTQDRSPSFYPKGTSKFDLTPIYANYMRRDMMIVDRVFACLPEDTKFVVKSDMDLTSFYDKLRVKYAWKSTSGGNCLFNSGQTFDELKSAIQKLYRRSKNGEFLGLVTNLLLTFGCCYYVEPFMKSFITSVQHRLLVICHEEGAFFLRTQESYARLVRCYQNARDAISQYDKIVHSIILAEEMIKSPCRVRVSSWYMSALDQDMLDDVICDDSKAIHEDIYLHMCAESMGGLDKATARLLVLMSAEVVGMLADTPVEDMKDFDFYAELEEEGFVQRVVRDRHVHKSLSLPETRTHVHFAQVAALCICPHTESLMKIRLKFLDPGNRVAFYIDGPGPTTYSLSALKQMYDLWKAELDKGAKPLERKLRIEGSWKPPQVKAKQVKRKAEGEAGGAAKKTRKQVKAATKKRRAAEVAAGPAKKQRKAADKEEEKAEKAKKRKLNAYEVWQTFEKERDEDGNLESDGQHRLRFYRYIGKTCPLIMNDAHPLGFKIPTYKVTKATPGPLSGLYVQVDGDEEVVPYDSLLDYNSQFFFKHVTARDSIDWLKLARKIGFPCQEVVHHLVLPKDYIEGHKRYQEQVREIGRLAVADKKPWERFKASWATRTNDVLDTKLKEGGDMHFMLVRFTPNLRQLCSIPKAVRAEICAHEGFIQNLLVIYLLHFCVIPDREMNTSNLGLALSTYDCERFDIDATDINKETDTRKRVYKGLQTHGISVTKVYQESLSLALRKQGAKYVLELYERTLNMLRNIANSNDSNLAEVAKVWLDFSKQIPTGVLYRKLYYHRDLEDKMFKLMCAYFNSDESLIPEEVHDVVIWKAVVNESDEVNSDMQYADPLSDDESTDLR